MRAASLSGIPQYWPGSAPFCRSNQSSWAIQRHVPLKSTGEFSCARTGCAMNKATSIKPQATTHFIRFSFFGEQLDLREFYQRSGRNGNWGTETDLGTLL